MPSYYFDKIFIEARYNNSLLFNDMKTLQELSNDLSTILPISKYDSNLKTLILINQDIHLSVNISENRIIIDMDSPNSFDDYVKYAKDIIQTTVVQLGIQKFFRIGMRTLRGIDKKNIKEADNFIKHSFIKYNDNYYKKLGDNVKNFAVGMEFEVKDYKINLSIRANNFQLLEIVNNKVNLNQQRFQVLIDSDVFQEGNIEVKRVMDTFIEDVIDINDNNIDNFIKNVSI